MSLNGGSARGFIASGALLVFVLAALVALPACQSGGEAETHAVADGTVWTCSMHPDVRQPGPGDCPICGMDLIPVETEPEDTGPRRLTVTDAGRKLMEVETAHVRRTVVDVEVPMVGAVTYDEGRVERIAAWVGGRIEKLHVDYEGALVRAGEPMVDLYSPGLVAAQEELLRAADAYRRARESASTSEDRALATLEAVRERLVQWGLSPAQVRAIEEGGEATEIVTLVAPVGGTVVEKSVTEGAYVQMGAPLYTIADLSRVWIELEAYESDLTWISGGDRVTFRTDAHPGRTFEGTVEFVDPVVDPMTRTVGVRVEAANDGGLLKPMMFVRATAVARFGTHGAPPLVVPATAPLLTGTRAVVYVEVPGEDVPTYEGREVVLGPRAGDYYVVESGLAEGELVVVEGAFKIDSALQIRAKPSMMSPDDGGAAPALTHDHGQTHGGSH
ncbi:MAG: efflux RND transporter periplasmic adaptor subunit [Candidatus Eisenbacteria bacterium]